MFGVSTSAYQIEGAWNEDDKGESIWDVFTLTPGNIENGNNGDRACDHYHRMESDVSLIADLGVGAYRFSVSWPRIFPTGKGELNQKGLDFYQFLVDRLLSAGIRPVLTLYHWDLPQALEEQGGWRNSDTALFFAEYAHTLFRVLGDRVPYWITHNEPWVNAFLGHDEGIHAPGLKDFAAALTVSRELLLSHGMAVQAFRQENLTAKIGLAHDLPPVHFRSENEKDREAARRFDGFHNRWFLDPLFFGRFPEDMLEWYRSAGFPVKQLSPREGDLVSLPVDFLGINYYFRHLVGAGNAHPVLQVETYHPVEAEYTEMGWEIYPAGLEEAVQRVNRDYAPREILVTENGIALPDILEENGKVHDGKRITYLQDHLFFLHRAMESGAPVHGYFVWSLMDNFEWHFGYSKRFGLLYTDFSTLKRVPKQSFYWYKELCRTKKIAQ